MNGITLIYGMYSDAGGGNSEFRVIPMDGRKHDPKRAIAPTYFGCTVGHWEGDTLVLDSIPFAGSTWFGRGGYFHSVDLHIIEKLTRKGDEILYELTAIDPEVLVKPWVMAPVVLRPAKFKDAGLIPECSYFDSDSPLRSRR